jgi:hypothetical protein
VIGGILVTDFKRLWVAHYDGQGLGGNFKSFERSCPGAVTLNRAAALPEMAGCLLQMI